MLVVEVVIVVEAVVEVAVVVEVLVVKVRPVVLVSCVAAVVLLVWWLVVAVRLRFAEPVDKVVVSGSFGELCGVVCEFKSVGAFVGGGGCVVADFLSFGVLRVPAVGESEGRASVARDPLPDLLADALVCHNGCGGSIALLFDRVKCRIDAIDQEGLHGQHIPVVDSVGAQGEAMQRCAVVRIGVK